MTENKHTRTEIHAQLTNNNVLCQFSLVVTTLEIPRESELITFSKSQICLKLDNHSKFLWEIIVRDMQKYNW